MGLETLSLQMVPGDGGHDAGLDWRRRRLVGVVVDVDVVVGGAMRRTLLFSLALGKHSGEQSHLSLASQKRKERDEL
jgi:hypothetical protein